MKKTPLLLLCLTLFAGTLPAFADQPALYTGRMYYGVQVFEQMDFASRVLGYIPKDKSVEVLQVEPSWLKVRYDKKLVGFIKRQALVDATVKTVDVQSTPPYGAVFSQYLAWVKEEAPILAEPKADAQAFITLQKGARLALIDFQDGWGRLIYHRDYAYVSANHLSEVQLLNLSNAPGSDAPIAAYTSFYKITTDESNLNRMVNLQVACDRFELYTIDPGKKLDFNAQIGPYSRSVGYLPANALVDGKVIQGYGGGTCQVSSTLYNTLMQLPGVILLRRRPHGPSAASYLPHGADAAVGTKELNLVLKNIYDFPIRIDGSVQDGALTIAVYRAD